MKHTRILLAFLLYFGMAQQLVARIVRTEEATALISTTQETPTNQTPSEEVTTPTEAKSKEVETPEKSQKSKLMRTKKTTKSSKHQEKVPVPTTPTPTAIVKGTEPTDMLDVKIKQIQEETEKEIASLKEQKEKKVTIIKRQEELKKLNEQQKALADELAKLDEKPTEKTPEKPAPTQVTTEWKVEQTAKFNRYSTELADTIAMGESDDAELQDFKQIFKDQQQWFDTTMTATKYVSDQGYAAINDRNKCLGLLVAAQKRSIPLLMKEVNMKKISKSAFDRLSTLLLYNLNSQINDERGWNKTIPEDNAPLAAIVKETLTEAKDPAFNKQTPAQKMLIELQKKLKETQDLIEQRNKTVLELELNIATNTEKLNLLKKDLTEIEAQKTKSESELKELQKKSADDIAALKAEKTKIESQLTQAQADAKEVKTKLDAATADSTKTSQEKAELQSQAKDLAKKVDDLLDKKKDIEKNLDEEQHKRRELQIQIEQAKFKQEQTENDRKKLAEENTKLDGVCKDLSDQVENKNKQALGLQVELERLRQKFAAQNKTTTKQTNKALNALRDDFEQQIHDLKIIMLKQVNPNSEELVKEEARFKAKQELEKQLEETLISEPEELMPQPMAQETFASPAEKPTSLAKASLAPITTPTDSKPKIEPVAGIIPRPETPIATLTPTPTALSNPAADDALALLAKVASEPIKPVETMKNELNESPSLAEKNKFELNKLEAAIKNRRQPVAALEPVASINFGTSTTNSLAEQNKKELQKLENKMKSSRKSDNVLPPPPLAI